MDWAMPYYLSSAIVFLRLAGNVPEKTKWIHGICFGKANHMARILRSSLGKSVIDSPMTHDMSSEEDWRVSCMMNFLDLNARTRRLSYLY